MYKKVMKYSIGMVCIFLHAPSLNSHEANIGPTYDWYQDSAEYAIEDIQPDQLYDVPDLHTIEDIIQENLPENSLDYDPFDKKNCINSAQVRQSNIPLRITTPGSYCLQQNINVFPDDGFGIIIDCDNVILNLNGFTIRVAPKSAGIYINKRSYVMIKNGSIVSLPHFTANNASAANSFGNIGNLSGSGISNSVLSGNYGDGGYTYGNNVNNNVAVSNINNISNVSNLALPGGGGITGIANQNTLAGFNLPGGGGVTNINPQTGNFATVNNNAGLLIANNAAGTQGVTLVPHQGICVESSNIVSINKIVMRHHARAIALLNSTNVMVANSRAFNSKTNGFFATNCKMIRFENTISNSNGASGFMVQNCLNTSFINSSALNNQVSGFSSTKNEVDLYRGCIANNNNTGFTTSNCLRCSYNGCAAYNNTGNGFHLDGTSIVAQQCEAQGNLNGFMVMGQFHTILSSVAQYNRLSGFDMGTSVGSQLRLSTAVNNKYGFNSESSEMTINSNFSIMNTTANYFGLVSLTSIFPGTYTATTSINFTANLELVTP